MSSLVHIFLSFFLSSLYSFSPSSLLFSLFTPFFPSLLCSPHSFPLDLFFHSLLSLLSTHSSTHPLIHPLPQSLSLSVSFTQPSTTSPSLSYTSNILLCHQQTINSHLYTHPHFKVYTLSIRSANIHPRPYTLTQTNINSNNIKALFCPTTPPSTSLLHSSLFSPSPSLHDPIDRLLLSTHTVLLSTPSHPVTCHLNTLVPDTLSHSHTSVPCKEPMLIS